MALLDCCLITLNEEELISYCLESFVSISDLLGILSVVDNNSTDSTLDILMSFRDRLPIVLQHHHEDSNHGKMRTLALQPCHSEWILYLDGDESFTSDMHDWLLGGRLGGYDMFRFFKYTTILDRYHYVEGGNGHTQRLFKNKTGVHFPQEIHTEPQCPGGWGGTDWLHEWNSPLLFDHTSCKSEEALWAKGWRYKWAFRAGIEAVGPEHEYTGRVLNTPDSTIREFPPEVKDRIFTGP